MTFEFRLEKALRVTLAKETAKKHEVGACLRRILILEQKVDACSEAIRGVLGSRRPEMALYEASKISHERQEMDRLERLIHDEKSNLRLSQAELKTSLSRRLALEKLRAKRFHEFRMRHKRQEQRRLDELWQLTETQR